MTLVEPINLSSPPNRGQDDLVLLMEFWLNSDVNWNSKIVSNQFIFQNTITGLVICHIHRLHRLVFFLQLFKTEIWTNVCIVSSCFLQLHFGCSRIEDCYDRILFDLVWWFCLYLSNHWNPHLDCILSWHLVKLGKFCWKTVVLERKGFCHQGIFKHLHTFPCNWRFQPKRRRFEVFGFVLNFT